MRYLLFALLVPVAFSANLTGILQDELQRNFAALRLKANPPPYYIAYSVTEEESDTITAANGAIHANSHRRGRTLDVSVRVGSPKFDNYHPIRGQRGQFRVSTVIAMDDVANSIRYALWLQTDRAWRAAAQRFTQAKTDAQTTVAQEDNSDDFSSEDPATFSEDTPHYRFAEQEWTDRLRRVSAQLAHSSAVLTSNVGVAVTRETRTLITTDGTRVEHGRIYARLVMTARGKAADGMDLGTGATFEAVDPERLPKLPELEAAARQVSSDLEKLIDAPVVEPFVGPAILSGRAAGVFFHEIFGHRVEGQRQRDEDEGQTFTKSVGKPVLPDFLSVVFDPTRRAFDGTELSGWYLYDDEGVKARPVTVVENGILKTFLMSRMPIKGFDHSNGHGRRQPGFDIVARQSNLIVESKNQVPEAKLREMLIAEIRRQGKPYGLYFRDVTSGYTTTRRRGLQAFTVVPVVVYRVYPDGRPDELVRGVDIVGTPLASFSRILATSDHASVFNGICGAESGNVPVSAISPALLVSEIEVQKKERSLDRPPFLPRPEAKP
ncbi:MAG: metallopeptidase TldD-related protein [Bryobacteraceae bacterium]